MPNDPKLVICLVDGKMTSMTIVYPNDETGKSHKEVRFDFYGCIQETVGIYSSVFNESSQAERFQYDYRLSEKKKIGAISSKEVNYTNYVINAIKDINDIVIDSSKSGGDALTSREFKYLLPSNQQKEMNKYIADLKVRYPDISTAITDIAKLGKNLQFPEENKPTDFLGIYLGLIKDKDNDENAKYYLTKKALSNDEISKGTEKIWLNMYKVEKEFILKTSQNLVKKFNLTQNESEVIAAAYQMNVEFPKEHAYKEMPLLSHGDKINKGLETLLKVMQYNQKTELHIYNFNTSNKGTGIIKIDPVLMLLGDKLHYKGTVSILQKHEKALISNIKANGKNDDPEALELLDKLKETISDYQGFAAEKVEISGKNAPKKANHR